MTEQSELSIPKIQSTTQISIKGDSKFLHNNGNEL
jgi:hypothetical protein